MKQLVTHLPNVNKVNKEFYVVKTSQWPSLLPHPPTTKKRRKAAKIL
jgi:hypothetical protein